MYIEEKKRRMWYAPLKSGQMGSSYSRRVGEDKTYLGRPTYPPGSPLTSRKHVAG
jgi:hypothetical protein